MQESRTTADKVRPILQAMERSIESARRNRTDGDVPDHEGRADSLASTPPVRREAASAQPAKPHIIRENRTERDEDEIIHPAQRMKARPKRPSAFASSFSNKDGEYRSAS